MTYAFNTTYTFEEKVNQFKARADEFRTLFVVAEHGERKDASTREFASYRFAVARRKAIDWFQKSVGMAEKIELVRIALIFKGRVMAQWQRPEPKAVQGYTMPELEAKYFPGDRPEPVAPSIAESGPGHVSPYNWMPEELAAYDEHEPIPPHTPGASADNTIASYEYEVAALKQQNRTLIDALADLYALAVEGHHDGMSYREMRCEIVVRVADVLSKIAPEAIPEYLPVDMGKASEDNQTDRGQA